MISLWQMIEKYFKNRQPFDLRAFFYHNQQLIVMVVMVSKFSLQVLQKSVPSRTLFCFFSFPRFQDWYFPRRTCRIWLQADVEKERWGQKSAATVRLRQIQIQ